MLKENHPSTYVINMLRHSARKRQIGFKITLGEFREWCKQTGYLEKRGRKADSMTVDRIDPWDDYTIENIRMLPHWLNSSHLVDNMEQHQI